MEAVLGLISGADRVIRIQESNGEPWWVTPVVAIVAALLGAAVGGFASFLANDRLERRRREARAAIRRKAKVYTPIRQELVDLMKALDEDAHLRKGINRTRPESGAFRRGEPDLFRWDEMRSDGRALTAASDRVRRQLEEVNRGADAFQQEVGRGVEVFDRVGRRIYREITGSDTTLVSWVHGDEVANALRDRMEQTHLFGFSSNEREENREATASFAELFRQDEEVQTTMARIREAEGEMRRATVGAIAELDRGMEHIAARYEREVPDE